MGIFDQKSSSTTKPISELMGPMMQGINYVTGLQAQGPYTGAAGAYSNDWQMGGAEGYINQAQGFGTLGQQQIDYGNLLASGFDPAMAYYRQQMNPETAGQYGQAYAFNDVTNNMVGSAQDDVYRSLNRDYLPSMAGAFSGAGVTDSSKYAQMDTLARSEADYNSAKIGDDIRFRQFGFGENLAAQTANQLMNAGNMGMQYMDQGYNNHMRPWEVQMQGGDYLQNTQQRDIDIDKAKWMQPWEFANMYGNYVNPLASQFTTTRGKQSMNPVGAAIGIGTQIGGSAIAGGWNPFGMGGAAAAGGGAAAGFGDNMGSIMQSAGGVNPYLDFLYK